MVDRYFGRTSLFLARFLLLLSSSCIQTKSSVRNNSHHSEEVVIDNSLQQVASSNGLRFYYRNYTESGGAVDRKFRSEFRANKRGRRNLEIVTSENDRKFNCTNKNRCQACIDVKIYGDKKLHPACFEIMITESGYLKKLLIYDDEIIDDKTENLNHIVWWKPAKGFRMKKPTTGRKSPQKKRKPPKGGKSPKRGKSPKSGKPSKRVNPPKRVKPQKRVKSSKRLIPCGINAKSEQAVSIEVVRKEIKLQSRNWSGNFSNQSETKPIAVPPYYNGLTQQQQQQGSSFSGKILMEYTCAYFPNVSNLIMCGDMLRIHINCTKVTGEASFTIYEGWRTLWSATFSNLNLKHFNYIFNGVERVEDLVTSDGGLLRYVESSDNERDDLADDGEGGDDDGGGDDGGG